jgi:hypothetical protein
LSNISRRREDPPLVEVEDEVVFPVESAVDSSEPELELDVEYFVEADELDSVRTSVPNPLQSPQSSSSAPSTFTVVSDD